MTELPPTVMSIASTTAAMVALDLYNQPVSRHVTTVAMLTAVLEHLRDLKLITIVDEGAAERILGLFAVPAYCARHDEIVAEAIALCVDPPDGATPQ